MAVLGAAVVAAALGLPEGTETGGPGTRFLPVVLGGLLVVLGARVGFGRAPAGGEVAAGPAPGGWARVVWTLAVLGAYVLAFERLGFLLATAAVVAVLLVAYGERRPPVVLAVALAATGATYALFALWLKVPLPRGVLGP
jgi:hypothetical protein